MNYIGSKRKLSPLIFSTIHSIVPQGTFLDIFAGTGAVSEKFAAEYQLHVNDWELYSYVINLQKFGPYVADQQMLEKIRYLNSIEGQEGFIFDNYSLGGSSRMYFSEENAAKIDAMRFEIDEITDDPDEKYYLIALLLEAADKVANVASVYGAYLKSFKATACKTVYLQDLPKYCTDGQVYCKDANDPDMIWTGDVAYLDPPYNTRHYGSNYHMLNTITTYDYFEPKGVTGLPDYQKSPYCSKVKIRPAFQDLLDKIDCKHIFISYNDEGILSKKDFEEICSSYGELTTLVLDDQYQRFKADSNRTQAAEVTTEFLYHIQK